MWVRFKLFAMKNICNQRYDALQDHNRCFLEHVLNIWKREKTVTITHTHTHTCIYVYICIYIIWRQNQKADSLRTFVLLAATHFNGSPIYFCEISDFFLKITKHLMQLKDFACIIYATFWRLRRFLHNSFQKVNILWQLVTISFEKNCVFVTKKHSSYQRNIEFQT